MLHKNDAGELFEFRKPISFLIQETSGYYKLQSQATRLIRTRRETAAERAKSAQEATPSSQAMSTLNYPHIHHARSSFAQILRIRISL